MEKESALMKFFLKVGFENLAWAFRRFHTPVDSSALVLEVGSGGNPYPRSNVLLDAYETTRERHWVPLITDRPTVLGFVENLPFKDKSFDFVIASHVLEHSTDPEKFLSELQRVARAGYIEVPDAFLERVNPYKDHRLEITLRDGKLIIFKKKDWIEDQYLFDLYEDGVKRIMTAELMPNHPFDFHVRYYWQDKIEYDIINPDVNSAWKAPASEVRVVELNLSQRFKGYIRNKLQKFFSQVERNKSVDVMPLLQCPRCHTDQFKIDKNSIECTSCGAVYPVRNGLIAMNEGA
jgi:SAM-dependent methyltransferase